MTNKTFEIIDQQDDFIVIHKTPGIGFHQEADQAGLFQQIQQSYADQTLAVDTQLIDSLFPVHRLDKLTSGLMLVATNNAAASAFGHLFSDHKIEKLYVALSEYKPRKKQGLIKGDMEKSRRGSWKLLRSHHNPAITQFKSFGTESGLRLFLLKPKTGKTHQIRVAMKSLGAAIYGDPLYSTPKSPGSAADRAYLHAFALRFRFKEKDFEYRCLPQQGEQFNAAEICRLFAEQFTDPWQYFN